MSLLAYNKTTSPLALAAGSPIVTLPAAAGVGARGLAFNVTGELKGLSNGDYALLQAQVAAGSVDFEWTGLPEYPVGSLVIGSAPDDVTIDRREIYVGDWSALGGSPGLPDDLNDGLSKNFPVATLVRARAVKALLVSSALSTNAPNTNINFAPSATAYPMPSQINFAGGADGSAAPETWIGSDVSQVGTIVSQAGSGAVHAIGTGLSPAMRSGSAASITAASGSGQTRAMTVIGMSGLTSADVGKFFFFALGSTPGNNGVFKMASFISATSGTFINAQSGTTDASNGAIYWQDWYRHATLRYTNGTAGPSSSNGSRKVRGHGVASTASVTISAMPADGNTLVVNDGTNSAVTFEWDSNGSVVESPTLKQLVFVGTETFAQLAAILRTKIQNKASVTPAQLRVNATNRAGSNQVKLENMIPGAIGNTASPTQTGAWATISTFASLATGVGDPLTTFSVIGQLNPAPTVGDSFVVEKPGVTLTGAPTTLSGSKSKLGVAGIKFMGGLTVFGMDVTWNKVEIDANGGNLAFTDFSFINVSEAAWSQAANNAVLNSNAFFSFHSGSLLIQDALALGQAVIDHATVRFGNPGRGSSLYDGQRTTFTLNNHMTHNAVQNFGTWGITADNALLATDSSVNIQGGIVAFGSTVVIKNSPQYGIVVSGSRLLLAVVSGDGNAKAGIRCDVGSDVTIDTSGTTSLAGELGEIEMGHETVPHYRTYTEVRVPDQYGSKQFTDGRGNWVRTAT